MDINGKFKAFLGGVMPFGQAPVKTDTPQKVVEVEQPVLLDTVLGTSLNMTWLGVSRQCSDAEKLVIIKDKTVAGTDLKMLKISKSLIDTKHKAYKALSKARSRVRGHWSASTMPWVRPGIRVLKKSNYCTFQEEFAKRIAAFEQARADFCAAWDDVVEDAKSRLGELFEPNLYPASLPLDTFQFALEYPSLIGDSSIEALDPAQFAKMKAAAEARLDEACGVAEKAFAAQLQELVGRVVHALTPEVDAGGNVVKKKMGQASLDAFKSFYETFKTLKVADHQELDALCKKALALAEGVDLTSAKTCADVASSVAAQFKGLAESISVTTGAKVVRKVGKKQTQGIQVSEGVCPS